MSDHLDTYLEGTNGQLGRVAVAELANMSSQQLGLIINVVYQILAVRSDRTPAEIVAANAETFAPTDEQWNGGVRSYIEANLIMAVS